MKVSKLITSIVSVSENKFGVSMHNNDCISVGLAPNPLGWVVWLERPSKEQMERGEIDRVETVKRYETMTALTCEVRTLMKALRKLQMRVLSATNSPF